MDEFSKQVRFLSKNNINTEQELLDYQKLEEEQKQFEKEQNKKKKDRNR